MYGLKSDWLEAAAPRHFTLTHYEGLVPRWCPGCGDHAILTAVQRVCREEQLAPEKTVMVSGIGCASRFPHYMKTYGFHGLHGRALPVAEGIRARRPDVNVFVATGDGDCCSIGSAHWLHAIRYNMKMVVMLFDNNVYGLTKMQTSPTTARGFRTNTHPRGAWLDPLDPIQTTLSITNSSFVAQTVDWNPAHLFATLLAAQRHEGLAFVRILQRCPHYTHHVFVKAQEDPSQVLLMTHEDGIQLPEGVARMFPNQISHDPANISEGRDIAADRAAFPIGLFYRNPDAQRYDDFSAEGIGTRRSQKIDALRAELDLYKI